MRVMDGDLIVPTCLRTPTLILSARHFVQLYYDPDGQGQYASDFPTRDQGFLQPRGDIRMSIVPRNFRILPDDVREVGRAREPGERRLHKYRHRGHQHSKAPPAALPGSHSIAADGCV